MTYIYLCSGLIVIAVVLAFIFAYPFCKTVGDEEEQDNTRYE